MTPQVKFLPELAGRIVSFWLRPGFSHNILAMERKEGGNEAMSINLSAAPKASLTGILLG